MSGNPRAHFLVVGRKGRSQLLMQETLKIAQRASDDMQDTSDKNSTIPSTCGELDVLALDVIEEPEGS